MQNKVNFTVGLAFVLIGSVFALAAALTLSMGTAAQMGPGFLPFYTALGLIGCGLLLVIKSFVLTHLAVAMPVVEWAVLLKLASLFLAYGFALRYLGLLPAMALLLWGGRWFYPALGWRRLLGMMGATLMAIWLLVSRVLHISLPLWPGQY